jgi:hypothetical protein
VWCVRYSGLILPTICYLVRLLMVMTGKPNDGLILKSEPWQTKLENPKKKSRGTNRSDTLYAHSTALPQSYPASIASGMYLLKCKALIRPYA